MPCRLQPNKITSDVIFIIILHPAKVGEKHPKITEFYENGKIGSLVQHNGKLEKITFNFFRKKRNDRIFELVGEEEPRDTYYFIRELPPSDKPKS